MQLGEYVFKTEASQGQRKTLLFALKLAEWTYLKQHIQLSPILLLDDVFEKLDEGRMQNLLHWICSNTDSQVFITDTHEERIGMYLNKSGINFQIISI
jgi:DNA replication and repair protein RecF